MNNHKSLPENQQEALLESIRELCRVFWGPTREACDQMMQERYLLSFATLDPELKISPSNALEQLAEILKGFPGPDALFNYLEEGYVRLFVNDRGRIIAPLYESCYEDEKNPRLMGDAAVRIQKRLESEGMNISDDIREPPDHLSIELELLYFLLTRSKPANNRMPEAAAFATQLLPWVTCFNARLANETRCRFYPLITAVLVSVLQWVDGLQHQG